jgi:hypothetical protein
MKHLETMRSFTLAAAAALLAACGSSSSSTTTSNNGGTTAGTNGFTRGVITAFGSVHLGDDVFTTTANTIRKRLDDGPNHIPGADDAVFRPGMVVQVFHKSDDKNATEIRFKDDLEGPITAKPSLVAGATLDVFGVPVLVDADTHFDDSLGGSGLQLATLAVGDVVELSGLFDASGVLHATFIEGKKPASQAGGRTFEMTGNIAGLAGTAPNQTFTVNGVSFSTNASTQTSDLPAAGLANGQFVEVKTTSTAAPFIVTKIEGTFEDPENEVRGADKAAVEGLVAGLTGASPNFSFKLGGTAVTTSASTTGLGFVTAGAHIEAEGPVVNGVINALTIGLRQ